MELGPMKSSMIYPNHAMPFKVGDFPYDSMTATAVNKIPEVIISMTHIHATNNYRRATDGKNPPTAGKTHFD